MRAGDASGDLFEERLLDTDELRGFDHVQDLLDLSEEHHLETQQSTHSAFLTINRVRIIEQTVQQRARELDIGHKGQYSFVFESLGLFPMASFLSGRHASIRYPHGSNS